MLRFSVFVLLPLGLTASLIRCPDGKVCPRRSTCCETDNGYECCPVPNDECCLSGTGCCPAGFHCNENKACVRSTEQDPSAVSHCSPKAGSSCAVTYCDRRFYCPVNNTCCKNQSGEWCCCPYPLGQCCPDKIHCCPYGYICDRRSTNCIKSYVNIPAALKEPAKRN